MFQFYLKSCFISVLYVVTFAKAISFNERNCQFLLNNCSCDSMQWNETLLADIRCTNITDFSNFSRILASGDNVDGNIFYEITFSDIKNLPARTLRGIYINKLKLIGPDITIDENVFEGIPYIREFYVERSSIKDIPDFPIVKDSIQHIFIHSSRLTSLEGKNLQNLTLAKTLSFLNNSIRFIGPDVFMGTVNVEKLDLSRNLLTSIPPKLLDPMWRLSSFSASYNNLQHVDNLFSVARPQDIYLGFNNITDVDSVLHWNMRSVVTLSLEGNPIKKLSKKNFNGKIPGVKHLNLAHCRLQEVHGAHFWSLRLKILDLSYNLIEGVYKPLPYIFFIEERITAERLQLKGNKLQSLTTILRNLEIEELDASLNKIQSLTDEDFNFVVGPLGTVELQENKIQRIDSKTFRGFDDKLRYLDLNSNLIQSLNRSVRYLSRLCTLNLAHNLIQSFAKDEFEGLNELEVLYLQYNQLKDLGQLPNLPQLQRLFINNNDIEFIESDNVPENLRFLYLSGNPLKCDCRLLPFKLRLTASNTPTTDVDLCSQSELLNSVHEKSQCPGMCSCGCNKIGNAPFMSVDCSSKNISILPEFLKNTFQQMQDNLTGSSDSWHLFVMDQNMYPSLHIEDRVLGINLENNNLDSLEGVELHPNLIQLYLANNRLRRLPESIFNSLHNLKQVSLSGNPWECDCKALKFKKWLTSNYAIIQDINDTRCGTSNKGESNLHGRVIWTMTDYDICPTNVQLIVSATIGILILLTFCLATKILYTKYELNIKVFLYFHGFTFVKEEDLDRNKIFDAFLSFSHKDCEFVAKEIISEIENKAPNVHLCIHYRDFRAGEFIHDNITHAVQNSKTTLLILSRNFLESEWCLMEFQVAHLQSLKDKVHRIIVVKVGDLPNKIDPQIQAYLDSTTYLTWGEKYFWKKLLYILPTSNSIRNLTQRFSYLRNAKYEYEYEIRI